MFSRINKKLKAVWSFVRSFNYWQIKHTGLFHAHYYLAANPDITRSPFSAFVHYIYSGWQEGRRPNVFFSPSFYLRQYPELNQKDIEPLLHYQQFGWREGKAPSLLFWPDYYVKQHPPLGDQIGNPLVHFLQHGWKQGRKPSPYFDLEYYVQNYPDVEESGLSTLDHFMTVGIKEKRRPGPFFNPSWCVESEVVSRDLSGEGTPQTLFNRYLRIGLASDEGVHDWFDPQFYRTYYSDVASSPLSALHHYLEKGLVEGRYPNSEVESLSGKTLISIVVPVYNPDIDYLNNCIRSVQCQNYPHWELCLADDCSTDPAVRMTLEKWSSLDQRIKVVYLEKNLGISGASNQAATMATGELIGFLDNDDELAVHCLFEVATSFDKTGAELFYSDEDLIGKDGRQTSVFYKPDFNRELLYSHNYVTHLVVTTRKLFTEVGGFSSEHDGAQDFDLFLKLSERANRIVHIQKNLYHWRASQTSTSINHSQKQYADEAGNKALSQALSRNKISGVVESTDWKFYYRCRRTIKQRPLVSILLDVDSDDYLNKLQLFHTLLETTGYSNLEVVLLLPSDFSSRSAEEEIYSLKQVAIEKANPNETKSTFLNRAAHQCNGAFLVLLGSNVTPVSDDWIESMLEYCLQNDTGFVGGRIRQQNRETEVNFTVPDISNSDPRYYGDFFGNCSTHLNSLECAQEVLTVSSRMAMCSKELFVQLGGFDDQQFPQLFYMYDCCLRLREIGYKNYYTPHSVVELRELNVTDSVTEQLLGLKREQKQFQQKWKRILQTGDPFWSKNLLAKKGIDQDAFLSWYAGDS